MCFKFSSFFFLPENRRCISNLNLECTYFLDLKLLIAQNVILCCVMEEEWALSYVSPNFLQCLDQKECAGIKSAVCVKNTDWSSAMREKGK